MAIAPYQGEIGFKNWCMVEMYVFPNICVTVRVHDIVRTCKVVTNSL
jgi:hypothetical protein